MLLFRCELVVRRIPWNACRLGVTHQVILALLPGRGLHGFDGTCPQRQLVVRDDQPVIHANHPSKAPARFAGAYCGIERKHRRDGVGITQVTFRAVQPGRKLPDVGWLFTLQAIDIHTPTTALQCHFNGFHHTCWFCVAQPKAVGDHVQHFPFGHFNDCRFGACFLLGTRGGSGRICIRANFDLSLGLNLGIATHGKPLLDLFRTGVGRQLHRKCYDQSRVARAGTLPQLGIDGFRRVVANRLRGFAIKQVSRPGKQQFQVIIELSHRAHSGAR